MKLRLTILALVLSSKLVVGQGLVKRDFDFDIRSSKFNSTGESANYKGMSISEAMQRITITRKIQRCTVDEKFNIESSSRSDGKGIMYTISNDRAEGVLFLFYVNETYLLDLQLNGVSVNMVAEEE